MMSHARDEQRQLEMERGQAVAAQKALSRRFNSEHYEIGGETEGARPSPDNKMYRERMGAQVDKS